MAQFKDIIQQVFIGNEDVYILARDEAQANSWRVNAFAQRKVMSEEVNKEVGVQKVKEDGKFFLRIYKVNSRGFELWVRDSETKILIPCEEK